MMQIKKTKSDWVLSLLMVCVIFNLPLYAEPEAVDNQADKKEPAKNKAADKSDSNPQIEKLKKWAQKNQLPIEPIIKDMERAGKLIDNQGSGKEAVQVQKQVITDLEKLIQLVEQAPKTSMRLQNQNNPQNQDQQQKRQNREGMQKQKNENQLSQGPARQSTDRQNEGQVTTGNLSEKNNYAKEAWGHLPPAMRQQLLNIYTEKFLPQYEDQVRRYYEALAEKKKRTP